MKRIICTLMVIMLCGCSAGITAHDEGTENRTAYLDLKDLTVQVDWQPDFSQLIVLEEMSARILEVEIITIAGDQAEVAITSVLKGEYVSQETLIVEKGSFQNAVNGDRYILFLNEQMGYSVTGINLGVFKYVNGYYRNEATSMVFTKLELLRLYSRGSASLELQLASDVLSLSNWYFSYTIKVNDEQEYTMGLMFFIERFTTGQWLRSEVNDHLIFNEIGIILSAQQPFTAEIEKLGLEPGYYRITKTVYDLTGASLDLTAVFEVGA